MHRQIKVRAMLIAEGVHKMHCIILTPATDSPAQTASSAARKTFLIPIMVWRSQLVGGRVQGRVQRKQMYGPRPALSEVRKGRGEIL